MVILKPNCLAKTFIFNVHFVTQVKMFLFNIHYDEYAIIKYLQFLF